MEESKERNVSNREVKASAFTAYFGERKMRHSYSRL